MSTMAVEKGKVFLVGAGPGAKGLLTLRAVELLNQCDVLVYDYLVNPDFRRLCAPRCEMIDVGKAPGMHSISQDEILDILVSRAREGKSIVRLKGGDPFVFGRGGEEMETLVGQDIEVEVVPGVTAALGCAAHNGIPLTHRDFSSSITFLTGHENPDKKEPRVDFHAFAKTGGTLCIYMGVGQAERISNELVEGGLPSDTAVAVIQWGTLAHQSSCKTSLGALPKVLREEGIQAPAMLLVGPSADFLQDCKNQENLPLLGRRVVVTRARDQAGKLRGKLATLGAEVLELPLIRVEQDSNRETLAEIFAEIAVYDWIVFTSVNGVRHFFDYFFRAFQDLRCLGPMRIAAIGQATAGELQKFHLQVDVLPEKAVSESLAEAMLEKENLENLKVLVITGSRNNPKLVDTLILKGQAIVDQLQVYRTDIDDPTCSWEGRSLRSDGADAILFTSTSTVESFNRVKDELLGGLARAPAFFSIGPKTTHAMKDAGMEVSGEAKEQTLDGLIQALLDELLGNEDSES